MNESCKTNSFRPFHAFGLEDSTFNKMYFLFLNQISFLRKPYYTFQNFVVYKSVSLCARNPGYYRLIFKGRNNDSKYISLDIIISYSILLFHI